MYRLGDVIQTFVFFLPVNSGLRHLLSDHSAVVRLNLLEQ